MRLFRRLFAGASLGHVIGGCFVGVGVLFAAIDSIILFKGWAAYGLDWWDKLSYGTAAASVPWVVAVYPFVWWALWLRGRWHAVSQLIIVSIVYLVLIAYSLVGAMGSIATQRGVVIADRKEARESIDSLKDQRNRYRNELGWIAKHRPPDQVAALIAAEKIKPAWGWTEGCRDIRNASQRSYCTGISTLQGELAAARKSEELHGKIAALSTRIDGRAPVGEKADPMAASVSYWLNKLGLSSVTETEASTGLPLATPTVLLIGEMAFIWCGFLLAGLTHRQMIAVPPAEALPALPPPDKGTLTRQHELAVWFFKTCARHAPDGSLPETDWYRHYCEVCKRSGDHPLPLAAFRRIAAKYVPSIKEVGGVTYYGEVLPVVPKEDAA